MKIKDLINRLENEMKYHGNIDVVSKSNDTITALPTPYAMRYSISRGLVFHDDMAKSSRDKLPMVLVFENISV